MSNAAAYVLKGAELLDEKSCGVKSCGSCKGTSSPVAGNWRTVLKDKGEALSLNSTNACVLGTLFKDATSSIYDDSYSKGLKALGIENGFQYGFDAPSGVTYQELKDAWLEYVGFKVAPKVEEVRYVLGDKLVGRWYSGSALRLDESVYVNGVKYYLGTHGDQENGKFTFSAGKPDLFTAEDLTKDFVKKAPFTAKEGDIVVSESVGRVWYVGKDSKAWELKNGTPATYVGLDQLIRSYTDLSHQQTGSGDKLVVYSASY